MTPHAVLSLVLLLTPPAPTSAPADVQVLLGTFVPGAQPDGNSVIFQAPGGVVVVDTGRHEAHAQRIVDVARSLGVPIAVVVNTHWHLDHVSGNPMLRRTFPSLTVLGSVAIDEALKGFLARYRSQLLQLSGESVDPVDRAVYLEEVARIDAGRALAPDVAVEESRTRSLAGRPMLVAVTRPAVTAADVWVFDPSSGVLAAGDLVTLPVPLLDTACVAGWQSAMASLVDVPFLLLVPGHGRPMTRDGFETYRRGLDHLVECAASDRPEQSCIEGWLDDLGSLVPEGERGFARALLGHYVPNVLRAPPDRSAGPCGKAPADRSGVAP